MEDFAIDLNKNKNTGELNMQVSPVCKKDGQKVVYVTFSDKTRLAEGALPKCEIISNKGFSEEELKRLQQYMKDNLGMLNAMAAEINPIKAMFK